MKLNYIRYGIGRPILLIHGLGGSWKSWSSILSQLASHREVIAIDLPGCGKSPELKGKVTISKMADEVSAFLRENGLIGIDAVGNSTGGRVVLELARRKNVVGSVLSLGPIGFGNQVQNYFFYGTIAFFNKVLRVIHSVGLLRWFSKYSVTRSFLLSRFTKSSGQLSPGQAFNEMFTNATSISFKESLFQLANEEQPKGAMAGSILKPVIIGWGRNDRVSSPSHAEKALEFFPDARMFWFDNCGHFPQWDQPEQTVNLILKITSNSSPASPLDFPYHYN